MKYKIMKYSHFNGYGEENYKYYYIKEKKSFLGIHYWQTITHDSYDEKVITSFFTQEKAEEFIREKLCKGVNIDKTTEIEIKTIECKCQ